MSNKITLLPTDNDRLAAIEARLDQGSARMDQFGKALSLNTEITSDIRDIVLAARTGFKVLGWLGMVFKWVGVIAAAGVAIYTAAYAMLHGGATPK